MLKLVCFAFLVIGCACLPEYEKDFSMEEYNNTQPPSDLDDNIEIPDWFFFPDIENIGYLGPCPFVTQTLANGVAFDGINENDIIFRTPAGPFALETIKLLDEGASHREPRLFVKFKLVNSFILPQPTTLMVMSRAYAPSSEADDNLDARANAVFVSLPSDRTAGIYTEFGIQWIRRLLLGGMKPKCLGSTVEDDVVTTSYVGAPVVVNFF